MRAPNNSSGVNALARVGSDARVGRPSRSLIFVGVVAFSVAPVQGGETQKEPWLEFKHLSTTQWGGYEQTVTKDGVTYYCAPTAFLDPIGFADVLPATDGDGVTIVLTAAARSRFREFTSDHVGEQIGIFIDGRLAHGPIVIGNPIAPRSVPIRDGLTADLYERVIEAWSAPIDLGPGKRRLYVQGLGEIEVELHEASPGDVCFLHQGSFYGLPLAFVARPELKPRVRRVREIVVNEKEIVAGHQRFATVQEVLRFIEKHGGPDDLLLVALPIPKAGPWSEERVRDLWPLIDYLHSHPPYAGLRQQMPDGWTWPSPNSRAGPESIDPGIPPSDCPRPPPGPPGSSAANWSNDFLRAKSGHIWVVNASWTKTKWWEKEHSPSGPRGERLTEEQARTLAARLANDECEQVYRKRPFTPESYELGFAEGRYRWGQIDPGAPHGLSAEVSFKADGSDPDVRLWFSTDALPAIRPDEGKPGE